MNKILLILTVFMATVSSLSLHYDPYSTLLNDDDLQKEQLDSTDPALSAVLDGKEPYWESFNLWQCFPTDKIRIECQEAEYHGPKWTPSLYVMSESHRFEFSMDPDPEPDCERIVANWKSLLEDERAFCVYAAFLQIADDVDESEARDGSLWIINELKTQKGYWKFEADENWKTEPKDPLGKSDEESISP